MGDLRGRRIAVVGAGGAARAVVAGLLGAGASVAVAARRPEQAAGLVAMVGGMSAGTLEAVGVGALSEWGFEALVNCTPAGMAGGPAPDQSPVKSLAGCRVVMDTVYAPLETPLLRQARGDGCAVVDGLGMFVRQAEAQFAGWTGRPPPAGLFERTARRELAARHAGGAG
jgi:shikimate 5-dehydrogenase